MRLLPHPQTPARRGDQVEAKARRTPDGDLALEYRLALASLRLPPPAPRQPAHGLWRATCCEVFVLEGAGPGYREFNLSPSGAHAAYRFAAYREGMAELALADPDIRLEWQGDILLLQAMLPAAALPRAPWRLGLSVVAERGDGSMAYWALGHAAEKPDFHHPDSFLLELA